MENGCKVLLGISLVLVIFVLYMVCFKPSKPIKPLKINKDTIEEVNNKLSNLTFSPPKTDLNGVLSKSTGTIAIENFSFSDFTSTLKNLFTNPKESIVLFLKDCLVEMVKSGKFENISLSMIPDIPLMVGYKLSFDSIGIPSTTDINVNIDINNVFVPSDVHILPASITYKGVKIVYVLNIPNFVLNLSIKKDNKNVLNLNIAFSVDINMYFTTDCHVSFRGDFEKNKIFGMTFPSNGINIQCTNTIFAIQKSSFNIVSVNVDEKDKYNCPPPFTEHGGGYMCTQPSNIKTSDCTNSDRSKCKKYTEYFKTKYAEPCSSLCDSNKYKNVAYERCPWVDDTSLFVAGNSCKWDNNICPKDYTPKLNTCVIENTKDWAAEQALLKSFGLTDDKYDTKKIANYIMNTFNFKDLITKEIESNITKINFYKLYKIVHTEQVKINFIVNVNMKQTSIK
tara:strand:+ start:38 stop:1393 length:1356 start_codon:yes stop_codon:yes gene_type:complete